MQTIYIDISNKGVIQPIYTKQGDIGRKFVAVFLENGQKYDIPSGSIFSAWYKSPSGEGNYTDIGEKSAFSVANNRVTVELISEMLGVPGDGFICLVLTKGSGGQIGSWNIPYICEEVPGFGSEEAKEYYTAFSKLVDSIKSNPENITIDDTLSVKNAAADAKAVGDKIGDISAALDAIIAIQEELMGVIKFSIIGDEYKAIEGMTWAEWVGSKYNTGGYIIHNGEVGWWEDQDEDGQEDWCFVEGSPSEVIEAGTDYGVGW